MSPYPPAYPPDENARGPSSGCGKEDAARKPRTRIAAMVLCGAILFLAGIVVGSRYFPSPPPANEGDGNVGTIDASGVVTIHASRADPNDKGDGIVVTLDIPELSPITTRGADLPEHIRWMIDSIGGMTYVKQKYPKQLKILRGLAASDRDWTDKDWILEDQLRIGPSFRDPDILEASFEMEESKYLGIKSKLGADYKKMETWRKPGTSGLLDTPVLSVGKIIFHDGSTMFVAEVTEVVRLSSGEQRGFVMLLHVPEWNASLSGQAARIAAASTPVPMEYY